MDSIGAGLFPGERVVSGMSLGRKKSMYGALKESRESNFMGFTLLPSHYSYEASNFGRP